jgi:tetratricopeptide (TPR) repeat protein
MQLTKTHKIVLAILIVLLLLRIYIKFNENSQKAIPNTSNETLSTTTTSAGGIQIKTEGGGSYTIEQVPIDEGKGIPQPIPDLSRPVTFADNIGLTSEVRAIVTQKITNFQNDLKKNANNIKEWIELGSYQKMAGDFDGAVQSWLYASKLMPTDTVSLGNLGNLYAYFIKDIMKAEYYYKEALAKAPTQTYLYLQLAEVYRDLFKDNSKASAIIEQGLMKFPYDPNLLQMKSTLK